MIAKEFGGKKSKHQQIHSMWATRHTRIQQAETQGRTCKFDRSCIRSVHTHMQSHRGTHTSMHCTHLTLFSVMPSTGFLLIASSWSPTLIRPSIPRADLLSTFFTTIMPLSSDRDRPLAEDTTISSAMSRSWCELRCNALDDNITGAKKLDCSHKINSNDSPKGTFYQSFQKSFRVATSNRRCVNEHAISNDDSQPANTWLESLATPTNKRTATLEFADLVLLSLSVFRDFSTQKWLLDSSLFLLTM